MPISFAKIKAGMTLFDVRRVDNEKVYWPVRIVSVDRKTRTASVLWNGNAATTWQEKKLCKLTARK